MIHLEKLTYENFDDVFELKVKKVQYPFVASNCYSIAEAYVTMMCGGHVFPFAIYNDKRLVGFIQIGYGENADQDGVSVEKDNYEIWRFMIDKRYQGRGYGREALKLALDFIRTWPCGKAEFCWISYEPENEIARKLYASFGFTITQIPVCRGSDRRYVCVFLPRKVYVCKLLHKKRESDQDSLFFAAAPSPKPTQKVCIEAMKGSACTRAKQSPHWI